MTTHLAPAPEPITEDDAFIERMLRDASIPALMLSIVHLTGDTSLLEGDIRPAKPQINEFDGALTEEQNARVRALALVALRAYRDRGGTLPPAPSPQVVRRMMAFLAGEEVADEYVPMMLEELALDGRDARVPPWPHPVEAARKSAFPVLVIGAGMSGLLQALRLKDAGIPFTLVEKNDSVGGTWYENRYPGCRVDIANHFYSYSFDPSQEWSEHFCRRDELLGYFRRFAERYGLNDFIRLGTEVTWARFDETREEWEVELRARTGATERQRYRAIVSAVGQLNRPHTPQIPGQDRFAGAQVHTAQWDPALALEGKRIAVVGSGASAFQLVPELAKIASRLTVFQRSAPWMLPNPIYHEAVKPGLTWLIRHVPYYGRWYRFLIFWPGTDRVLPSLRIDPAWPHPERAVSEANDQMRTWLLDYMKTQVGDDPELLEKVTPKYPAMGKRMLQDNGSWLRALRRPNVELVTEAVTRIDERGIVGRDRHYDVDVIIYATGFKATRFLWPMQITGRAGRRLDQLWGDEPRAYLGITVPGFPNFYMLYGPATNLAHAGSIIFHSECQVRYATACIQSLIAHGARSMDLREEVYEAFNRRLEAEHEGLIWSHPAAASWYRNRAGKVVATSPWRLVDYWNWTRGPDLTQYTLTA